jgi:hypothetical protein
MKTSDFEDAIVDRGLYIVMPGLVPGIHVFSPQTKDVDGRNKSGYDKI